MTTYVKPAILSIQPAKGWIQGNDKDNDMVDSGQAGVHGTIGAYQADE